MPTSKLAVVPLLVLALSACAPAAAPPVASVPQYAPPPKAVVKYKPRPKPTQDQALKSTDTTVADASASPEPKTTIANAGE
jgi:hypothetical protein